MDAISLLGAAAVAAGGYGLLRVLKWSEADIPYQWRQRRLQEGATSEQVDIEAALLMAMARLRRRASEAVVQSPADHKRILKEGIAVEGAYLMSMHGRPVCDIFVKTCEDLRDDEILYPDAMAAVEAIRPAAPDNEFQGGASRGLDPDIIAAFTNR